MASAPVAQVAKYQLAPLGRQSLDSDPHTPGVQVHKDQVRDFLAMDPHSARDFLLNLDPPSFNALGSAFNAQQHRLPRWEQARSWSQLTRGLDANMDKPLRTDASIRSVDTIRNNLVVDGRGGRAAFPMNLPQGFRAQVQPDKSVIISREDGRRFREPGHSNPIDRLQLYPDFRAGGEPVLRYQTTQTRSYMTQGGFDGWARGLRPL